MSETENSNYYKEMSEMTAHNESQVNHINSQTIYLKAMTMNGREYMFRMNVTMRMESLMKKLSENVGKCLHDLVFMYDGSRIAIHHTPKELKMDNYDTIEVIEVQRLEDAQCERCIHESHSHMSRCAECHLLITDPEESSMGLNWHIHCFKCDKCQNPISPENYRVKNGKVYCGCDDQLRHKRVKLKAKEEESKRIESEIQLLRNELSCENMKNDSIEQTVPS